MKITQITFDPYNAPYDVVFLDEDHFMYGDDLCEKIDAVTSFLLHTKVGYQMCHLKFEPIEENKEYHDVVGDNSCMFCLPNPEEKLTPYLERLKTKFEIIQN